MLSAWAVFIHPDVTRRNTSERPNSGEPRRNTIFANEKSSRFSRDRWRTLHSQRKTMIKREKNCSSESTMMLWQCCDDDRVCSSKTLGLSCDLKRSFHLICSKRTNGAFFPYFTKLSWSLFCLWIVLDYERSAGGTGKFRIRLLDQGINYSWFFGLLL